jgi:hypothetical protein
MTTATQVQWRRGAAAQVLAMTPAAGEVVADMTNFALSLGDGSTAGGRRQASEAYVTAAVAALTGGTASTLTLWTSCG